MSTRDRLVEIVIDALGIEAERCTDEAKIIDDLGADSLDIIEIVMMVEDRFNVSISDDEAERIVTIADAQQLIGRLRHDLAEARS